MAFLADYVLDAALAKLTSDVNRLDVCSAEPTTYTEATSTDTLGNKTSPTVSSAADRTGGGRKVSISAITDGDVTATGTATHWALSDTANSRLLATGSLSASQALTSGNTFTLAAFDVGVLDAVDAS